MHGILDIIKELRCKIDYKSNVTEIEIPLTRKMKLALDEETGYAFDYCTLMYKNQTQMMLIMRESWGESKIYCKFNTIYNLMNVLYSAIK